MWVTPYHQLQKAIYAIKQNEVHFTAHVLLQFFT